MSIFYCHVAEGNFGDDLNSWIWHELFGEGVATCASVLVGIGTILDEGVYSVHPSAPGYICFGSGTGYGRALTDMGAAKWLYKVVRGPLSAAALNLESSHVGTDGAILLASLERYRQAPVCNGRTIFIPHHSIADWPYWEATCNAADIDFVNPGWDCRLVLDRIRSARLVIADSMHAAICADTFRVPWVAVSSGPRINTFKWTDWSLSMDLPYSAKQLPLRSAGALLDSILIDLQGERHRFPSATPDTLLTDFIEHQRQAQTPSARFLAKQRRRLERRLIRPLADFCDTRLGPVTNRQQRMADALVDLAKCQGILSNERAFQDRLTTMTEHRRKIADVLAIAA